MEPQLLIPPALTSSVLEELKIGGYTPRHWHLEGRYGSRVAVHHSGRRSVPVLPSVVPMLRGCLRKEGDEHMVEDEGNIKSEGERMEREGCAVVPSDALCRLLRHEGVELVNAPPTPAREPKPEGVSGVVHHERRVEVTNLPPPAPGAFTFVELFAGVGGFGVGLEALGGRCVFASEIAPESREVYTANFPHAAQNLAGDIWGVDPASIPEHDILTGGFPCQPFSALGLQPGLEDDRGQLFEAIVGVLKACRPKAFILENVPGLVEMEQGATLTIILDALKGAGYDVRWELVNARCLTAQVRNRIYIVGLRIEGGKEEGQGFQFPYIPDLEVRAADVLQTKEEAAREEGGEEFELTPSQFDQLLKQSIWKPCKLAWNDKQCNTLNSHYGVTVGKGNSQLVPQKHPHHPRRFTPRECARLMGFPDSRFVLGCRGEVQGIRAWIKAQYRMIGNAVSPPVIAVLGGAILARILPPPPPDGCDWVCVGRAAAVRLALGALAPQRRRGVAGRLHASFLVREE
eukprot:Hpha_TRINITY_DN4248_c0_g1::TRINITY_DN4248_c0_g1_i1::g.186730::m.186730/K00558/DNMT1, dcm; DNA (cytosine-5)-methyltransferase 1